MIAAIALVVGVIIFWPKKAARKTGGGIQQPPQVAAPSPPPATPYGEHPVPQTDNSLTTDPETGMPVAQVGQRIALKDSSLKTVLAVNSLGNGQYAYNVGNGQVVQPSDVIVVSPASQAQVVNAVLSNPVAGTPYFSSPTVPESVDSFHLANPWVPLNVPASAVVTDISQFPVSAFAQSGTDPYSGAPMGYVTVPSGLYTTFGPPGATVGPVYNLNGKLSYVPYPYGAIQTQTEYDNERNLQLYGTARVSSAMIRESQ